MANKISGPEPKCERDLLNTAKVPEPGPGVTEACVQFAAEITRVLSMDGLAVVLLDPEGNTSRVVYSWTKPVIRCHP
jgi:hypothetical protein